MIADQLVREFGDDEELFAAFDLRMAGQDLLDQGRSGAMHSDDEDRAGTRVSPSLAFLEKLLREGVADECGAANDRISSLPSLVSSADLAAALDVADRPFEFACGIQCLGEREMKRDFFAVGQVVLAREPSPFPRCRSSKRPTFLRSASVHQAGPLAGLSASEVRIAATALPSIAERLQQIAVIDPVQGDVRIERDQLAIGCVGLVETSSLHHHLGLQGQRR